MRTVQIDYDVFTDLIKYHCLDMRDETRETDLKAYLEDKLDKLVKREIYTRYKTAETPEERERARRDYLTKIGVPEDFRW